MHKKESLLFLILAGFFITNALVAEFIGVKIFSLEGTRGNGSLSVEISLGSKARCSLLQVYCPGPLSLSYDGCHQ